MQSLKLSPTIFAFSALFIYNEASAQKASNQTQKLNTASNEISISVDGAYRFLHERLLPNSNQMDSIFELAANTINYTGVTPERNVYEEKIHNDKVVWRLKLDEPVNVNSPIFGYWQILTPGDSINIMHKNEQLVFSGRGAEKFKMQYEIGTIQKKPLPTKNPFIIESVSDYYNWLKYLDHQLELILVCMERYKNAIPLHTYNLIKTIQVYRAEVLRTSAFNGLLAYVQQTKYKELDSARLNELWDTTQKNTFWGKWLRSQTEIYGEVYYFYDFNRLQYQRDFNFSYSSDSIRLKKPRVEAYYNLAKKLYTGLLRERLLQYIVALEIVTEIGPADEFTRRILSDYFQEVKLPEYKSWMESYCQKALALRIGKRAPYFSLPNEKGKLINKNNLLGKVALIYFWSSDYTGCVPMTSALKQVKEAFIGDTNVVFVNISIDDNAELWQKSIKASDFCSESSINLHTAGQSTNHSIIKWYNITDYPTLVLFDAEGKILSNPVPDPQTVSGQQKLTGLLRSASEKITNINYKSSKDGPYVLNDKTSTVSYYIDNGRLFIRKNSNSFVVPTDEPAKSFRITLKSKLSNEPVEFKTSGKILALSDIEGNFEAFRKLLQISKVIDSNFKWIFGNGHLVFAGDMFDRGLQVTECLWLIYSLEEMAKASGGYVHFILGNHEIMNMQGVHTYSQPKYHNSAALIGKTIAQLYNEDSELGKWLRTKNIVEKINDLLFVHGGISPEINRMQISLQQLNHLAQRNYNVHLDSSNQYVLTIFNDKRKGNNDKSSPFWFRGYYGDLDNPTHIPTIKQVDSTLTIFKVNRIITGHTIVSDTISLWYQNKVINIDTHHASGKSEVLLVDKGVFFRLNLEGEKKLLLDPTRSVGIGNKYTYLKK